jgi:aryl-alcohol dehydrogenase-like predicted oxidoreductase
MATALLKTAPLGATGMEITRIGFGAWAIGGGGQFGWGEQEDADSVAAIEHALALGINWIDTAPAYGFGRSEAVVGRALANVSGDQRPFVFTKCSLLEGPGGQVVHNLKRDSLLREAEESAVRLGVDAIDLYQIHWPDPVQDIGLGWGALVDLREQGLVKHIGVSNFSVEQLKQIGAVAPVETLQPPYSLVTRGVEDEILPYCEAAGIGVIVYSPMASGLLSGAMTRERIANLPEDDFRSRDPRFTEPQLTANLEIVERLQTVAAKYDTSTGAVATAWTLLNPGVDAAIVGFRRPDQVDPLIAAAGLELTPEDVRTIQGG